MWLGALTMHLSAGGIATGLLGRLPGRVHDPLDDVRVGELDDDAVALPPGDGERLRPVAGDVHLDLGQLRPHPLELELLVVPGDLLAVHERLHHLQRFLEVRDPHRLAADVAHGRVAAADAHDHAAVRDVLEGRVRAREHRRVADRRVRDHVAELDRRGLVGEERHHRHRLLPEHVRVVGPAVLEPLSLGELRQLDQALVRRVGQDGDAEAEQCRTPGESCAGKEAFSRESRRVATWPYYLFAIAAGAMLPIQFGVNAQLATWVGSPLRATLVSFVVGTAVLLVATLIFARGWPGSGRARGGAVVGLGRRFPRRLLRARLGRDGTEARRSGALRVHPRRPGRRLARRRPLRLGRLRREPGHAGAAAGDGARRRRRRGRPRLRSSRLPRRASSSPGGRAPGRRARGARASCPRASCG